MVWGRGEENGERDKRIHRIHKSLKVARTQNKEPNTKTTAKKDRSETSSNTAKACCM